MLEHSQRLDSDTLMATARTKSQQHLLAISRRNSLDEALTDVLVERGDKSVVLSTAGNPGARFSDTGYAQLTTRSEGDDELAACVGLRRDIPRHHLMRLLVKASHTVRQKLEAANPSMSALIEDAVSEAAATVLGKASVVERNYAAARSHVGSLRAGGRLNENEVADFARTNQFEDDDGGACAALRIAHRDGRAGDDSRYAGRRHDHGQGAWHVTRYRQNHLANARAWTRYLTGRT